MKKSLAGALLASALLLLEGVSYAFDDNLTDTNELETCPARLGDPDGDLGRGALCVMALLGVDSPEDLDGDEVESLSAYLDAPLEINRVSQSRLVSSGLFTPYMAASLVDYRSRHGDVLSLSELAAVDGFTEDFVRALAPFVSLYSSARAGRTSEKVSRVADFLTMRSSVRSYGGQTDYNYGVKYRLEVNDRFELGLSANRAYGQDGARPDGGSFYLACYGDRGLGKVVVGDYRLRFGQGLLLWNGFRVESFSSPQSYCVRSSGISPYWSFTGNDSYRGAAADFSLGRFTVSTALAVNGLRELMDGRSDADLSLMPAVNVSWYGSRVRVGVSGYCETAALNGAGMHSAGVRGDGDALSGAGCSADFRWCPGGTDVFGEVAADLMTMDVKAVAGTVFKVSDLLRMAVKAGYSGDLYSLSAGGEFHAGESVRLWGKSGFGSEERRHTGWFGVEARCYPGEKYGAEGPNYQVKAVMDYALRINPRLSLAMRYALRVRSAGETLKNDLRADLRYGSGEWSAVLRVNAVYNTGLGLLSYAEGGWTPGRMSFYLRAGMFRIDNWADRIYVYERDAPGNYNVPAYYGRGVWGAFTAGVKAGRICRVYLRVSTLQYPWESPTAGTRLPKTEGRLMVVLTV